MSEPDFVDDDLYVEVAMTADVANRLGCAPRRLQHGEVYVCYHAKQEGIPKLDPVIERDLNILTADDLVKNRAEADQAQCDELLRWNKHKVMARMLRKNARNTVTSRWVMKYKIVKGVRKIKARLTVHGFKDRQKSFLKTYAATANRSSQRVVCSVAVQNGWKVWAMDVSMAFLRGKTFDELSKHSGVENRSLQFELPKGGLRSVA